MLSLSLVNPRGQDPDPCIALARTAMCCCTNCSRHFGVLRGFLPRSEQVPRKTERWGSFSAAKTQWFSCIYSLFTPHDAFWTTHYVVCSMVCMGFGSRKTANGKSGSANKLKNYILGNHPFNQWVKLELQPWDGRICSIRYCNITEDRKTPI